MTGSDNICQRANQMNHAQTILRLKLALLLLLFRLHRFVVWHVPCSRLLGRSEEMRLY